ncbi:MAG: S8 family serine peptidase [Pirellulales bacterium]
MHIELLWNRLFGSCRVKNGRLRGSAGRGKLRNARRQVFERLEARDLMASDLLQLNSNQYDNSHLLVQFRSAIDGQALIGKSIAGGTVSKQLSSDGWFQITINPSTASISNVMTAFQSRTDVLSATPDFRVTVTATPNDPSYTSEWGLENNGVGGKLDADIDASEAWDYGTSSSVVVAVIDSGVDYNHQDLAANIWTNSREIAGNGKDDDGNGYVDDVRGWNFVSNNNNPMDDNGHGTHVAGTIGAVGNNGIGVTGIAWNVKIMALKFLDSTGSGLLSDAVSAIDYARVNGAKIINASWGGDGFSSALQAAIQRFQNAGGIFVTAAGNDALNNSTSASYPANYALSNVISVAASTQSDTLASFSNYGSNVDIAAPGVNILSTVPNNSYARYSGTSMATPHVAGAMALLWGQSPSLTASQLIDLVMNNTDNVLVGPTQHGRLNLGKAAAALHGSRPTDTTSPYVTNAVWNISDGTLSTVDVTFSEPVAPTSMTTPNIKVYGPFGEITITGITALDASGTKWRIAFSPQAAVGNYTLNIAPTVTDLAGNKLDQDRDGTGGEAVQDVYTATTSISSSKNFTTTGPITLQDATSTRSGVTQIAVEVTDSFSIADLNVDLSIDHTYVGDLRIRLIGPDGTSVQLVNRRGGSRDNIRVVFDDEASQSIATVTGNLSGSLKPERALSAFDGKNAKGRWILEVTDAARLDIGTLNSVTLSFSGVSSASAAPSTTSSHSSALSQYALPPELVDLWIELWSRLGRNR